MQFFRETWDSTSAKFKKTVDSLEESRKLPEFEIKEELEMLKKTGVLIFEQRIEMAAAKDVDLQKEISMEFKAPFVISDVRRQLLEYVSPNRLLFVQEKLFIIRFVVDMMITAS